MFVSGYEVFASVYEASKRSLLATLSLLPPILSDCKCVYAHARVFVSVYEVSKDSFFFVSLGLLPPIVSVCKCVYAYASVFVGVNKVSKH